MSLIRKNWILKGIRGLDIGSKPHSNEEIFSRFLFIFFIKVKFKVKSKIGIQMIIIE